jgi:hypothetical protein
LNISGIQCDKLKAVISGSLRPADQKEEYQENGVVKVVEVSYGFPDPLFYNFSESSVSEVRFEGRVNVTVPSKSVKQCIITLNNQTTWDLTDDVLMRDEGGIYLFPSDTRTLGVHLVLYKFNAWLFQRTATATFIVTKTGITEEYFSPERNEVIVLVDLAQASIQDPRIAVRTAGALSGVIIVNDIQRPLESLLLLNNDAFLAVKVMAEEDESPYTIKCSFNSNPVYSSLTTQPFNVAIDNDYFEIYTPLNCEAQVGVTVPVTIKVFTFKTFVLRIKYDSSAFNADSDELIVHIYSSYVYFMLKPLREGSTEIIAYFINPAKQNSTASIPFLVNVKRQLLQEVALYMLLVISALSLVYIVVSRDQLARLTSRLRRKRT